MTLVVHNLTGCNLLRGALVVLVDRCCGRCARSDWTRWRHVPSDAQYEPTTHLRWVRSGFLQVRAHPGSICWCKDFSRSETPSSRWVIQERSTRRQVCLGGWFGWLVNHCYLYSYNGLYRMYLCNVLIHMHNKALYTTTSSDRPLPYIDCFM